MDFDHDQGLLQSNSTGVLTVGGTAGLVLPVGTTAQRPGTPVTGTMRVNSTTSQLEYYNNGAWSSPSGGVSSVALTLPSIFSVIGSPITSAGTITASLVSQAQNTVLAGPASGSGVPTFRQLSLNSLSDVNTGGAAASTILSYNGSQWVPTSVAVGSASGTLASWTSIGGSPTRYTATFTHNLGTYALVVSLYDTATNKMVLPDALTLTDANTVVVTIASNARSLRIVVVANGLSVAASTGASVTVQNAGSTLNTNFTTLNFTGGVQAVDAGGGVATISASNAVVNLGGAPSLQEDLLANRPAAGTAGALFLGTDDRILYRDTGSAWVPITCGSVRTLSYVAAALDTPNSADWVVNAMAAGIPDPTYNSVTVRSFSDTIEQGVGILVTPPASATVVTITFKGRAQTAPGAAAVVQPRIYRRQFPNGTAPGAWGAAVELANIPIPTNAFYTYASQTLTLASLGWNAGQMTMLEITRRVTGVTGTNLTGAFLLAELTFDFQ